MIELTVSGEKFLIKGGTLYLLRTQVHDKLLGENAPRLEVSRFPKGWYFRFEQFIELMPEGVRQELRAYWLIIMRIADQMVEKGLNGLTFDLVEEDGKPYARQVTLMEAA